MYTKETADYYQLQAQRCIRENRDLFNQIPGSALYVVSTLTGKKLTCVTRWD